MNLRDVADYTTPSLTLGAKFLYSCQTPGKVFPFIILIIKSKKYIISATKLQLTILVTYLKIKKTI